MGESFPVLHAADLAAMLPRESRCSIAQNPDAGWSSEAVLLSIIEYRLHQIVYSLAGGKDKHGNKMPYPEPIYKPKSDKPKNEGLDIDELKELLARPRTVDNGD